MFIGQYIFWRALLNRVIEMYICLEKKHILLRSQQNIFLFYFQFSVPQIEYPLGGQQQKGISCILPVDSWHGTSIVISYLLLWQQVTIVLPRKLAIGSIHDYLFVGILFEVLRFIWDVAMKNALERNASSHNNYFWSYITHWFIFVCEKVT